MKEVSETGEVSKIVPGWPQYGLLQAISLSVELFWQYLHDIRGYYGPSFRCMRWLFHSAFQSPRYMFLLPFT